MKKAMYPGSFDPITRGHLDIIRRAAEVFDHLTVLLAINPEKEPNFTVEERLDMIRRVTKDLPNVTVEAYQGLTVDYAREEEIPVIVRGLRAVSDFENEFQMALTNRKMYPEGETLFLNTSLENMYLSSSMVRDVARFGGNIAPFVPEEIEKEVAKRLLWTEGEAK